MNWLARLEIDSEIVRTEGMAADIYAWHKGLWKCFPGEPEAKRDFLTRIDQLDGSFRFWVLAKRKPVRPQWCPSESFALKEIAPSFLSHRYYAFDLKANPVKKIVQRGSNGETLFRANGKRKTGKRVPLVKQDELRAWLVKKGKVRCRDEETGLDVPGGFQIIEDKPLEISPMAENHFRKVEKRNGKKHSACHGGVQFRGTLEVVDSERFVNTYQSGIGSAKGFGFGLFLLAPINLKVN